MRFFPSLLLFLLITACAEEMPEETQSPEASARVARETPVEVRVQPVQRGSFPLRTISSGVLEAALFLRQQVPGLSGAWR
jgi:hypothetical protein